MTNSAYNIAHAIAAVTGIFTGTNRSNIRYKTAVEAAAAASAAAAAAANHDASTAAAVEGRGIISHAARDDRCFGLASRAHGLRQCVFVTV